MGTPFSHRDAPPGTVAAQLSYAPLPAFPPCNPAEAPQIAVASPVEMGEGFRVCVAGFQPGELVEVTLSPPGGGNSLSKSALVDADGVSAIDETIPPGGEPGVYRVTAVETLTPADGASTTTTPGAEATLTVTLARRVLVAPASGAPGATFTIELDGFPTGTPVTLHLYGPGVGVFFTYMTMLPPIAIDASGAGSTVLVSEASDMPGTYCLAFADSPHCETTVRLG